MILKIRELLDKGYKNVEIEKELNLKRFEVERVKNGLIVLRTEQKQNKVKIVKYYK